MGWRSILLIVLGLAGGLNWWIKRTPTDHSDTSASIPFDKNAFVPVEMPGGTPRNTVLVLAPPNCPSERAKRADALVSALQAKGIPVTRGDSISFEISNPSIEQREGVERTMQVFRQGAPAVYVNGMGMSNPDFAQVAAVYEKTRH
jgi:hypothetical protein